MLNTVLSRWLSSLKLSRVVPSDSAAKIARRRSWYRGAGTAAQDSSSRSNFIIHSTKAFDYYTVFKVLLYSYGAYFTFTQVISYLNRKGEKKKKKQPLHRLQVELLNDKLQSYSDSFREASTDVAIGTPSTLKGSIRRGRDPQLLIEVSHPF